LKNSASSQNTIVFGACSAIASAWIELRAAQGDSFFLIDQDSQRLELLAGHIRTKFNCDVQFEATDLTAASALPTVINNAFHKLNNKIGRVLLAHGYLGDQTLAQTDFNLASKIIDVNFTSCMHILSLIAPRLSAQGYGTIIGISSVAGDRGRSSNYVYGSAKAAFTTYLSGLRASLHKTGVRVITIKPGMVDTPMTADMKKGLLFSQPEQIARSILKAEQRSCDVVYAPRWWRFVMLPIIHIPEFFFMRLKF
jgi:short-subunit dehydrogenase